MKNEHQNGGLRVTDVECLDRSLKLRQFIRASKSKHVIARIQQLIVETENESPTLRQEYYKVTKSEDICTSAQETINIITDYNRVQYSKLEYQEIESDKNLIEEIASINIETFLKRKNRVFSLCILKPITKLGITTLGELIQGYEHESDSRINKSMALIINSFPKYLIEIAKCFNEDLNEINNECKYILVTNNSRLNIEAITAKEFQTILKSALGKLETINFENKLDIENYDSSNITTFRKHCKNAKLRNIYLRLIHNDFFTYSRMKRYKMTPSDQCPRCSQSETTRHLLWECEHSKNIWSLHNDYLNSFGITNSNITEYKHVYNAGTNSGLTMIKIKVIQELIQIRRPLNWNMENIRSVVEDLVKIERHNYNEKHQKNQFESKWKFVIK
jgi:hypothetical protein